MADGISVGGGAGSAAAALDDLLRAAAVLDRVGDDLRGAARGVSAAAFSPDVAEAAVLCPVEAGRAGLALGGAAIGPEGVVQAAAGTEFVGFGVRACVETYREADRLAQEAFESVRWSAGWAAGAWTVTEGLPIVAVTGGAAALVDVGTDGAVHRGALSGLYDLPWLTEQLVGAAPAFGEGAILSLLGPAGRALLEPCGWPAGDLDGVVDATVCTGQSVGLFTDRGPFHVTRLEPSDNRDVVGPATSLTDLFGEQSVLGQDGHENLLTVREVRHDDGSSSWVAQIPGTQDWSPMRSSTPVDMTSNVRLMAGQHSELQRCVAAALRQAGVQPGDHVMLAGHSLGGIAAASLAADPSFTSEFAVTSVVTGGSPVARFDIPPDVSVLSLEHDQDVVPMLDGRPNPQSASWVTVRRDLEDPGGSPGDYDGFADAHGTRGYVETARQVDTSDDPSLLGWRQRNAEFLDGTDQQGHRFLIVPGAPTAAGE